MILYDPSFWQLYYLLAGLLQLISGVVITEIAFCFFKSNNLIVIASQYQEKSTPVLISLHFTSVL